MQYHRFFHYCARALKGIKVVAGTVYFIHHYLWSLTLSWREGTFRRESSDSWSDFNHSGLNSPPLAASMPFGSLIPRRLRRGASFLLPGQFESLKDNLCCRRDNGFVAPMMVLFQ